MDGVYQKRIRVGKDSSVPIIISALKDGPHEVWIYKATEAATGAVYIRQITGSGVKVLPNPNAPLIEFIGNSITCGAAADPSEVACGAGQYYDQHNAYYAYGPRSARSLGMNYILSSVSGIGIYRNWNSDGPTMPQVYEKLDLQLNDRPQWDFSKYRPTIISIALGTNDMSNGDGKKPRLIFDSSIFVANYIKFVQLVKSKYPSAQIVLLSSPMVGGQRGQLLENCVTAVKSEIDRLFPESKPVALFFFKPMQARGCSGHPNVEDHAIMAEQLTPFLKKFL
jgi:lysophospholipase L1-like esterase